MKNQFLKTNLKALKNPVAWLGNLLGTLFCVGVVVVIWMALFNVDIAKTTSLPTLFKMLWLPVLLGYALKFLLAYYGQYKRNMLSYWFGALPELALYLLTFVVILLTGDYAA